MYVKQLLHVFLVTLDVIPNKVFAEVFCAMYAGGV